MLYYIKDFKGRRAKWNGDIKIDDHYELTTNVNDLAGTIFFLLPELPLRQKCYQEVKGKTFTNLIFKEKQSSIL